MCVYLDVIPHTPLGHEWATAERTPECLIAFDVSICQYVGRAHARDAMRVMRQSVHMLGS